MMNKLKKSVAVLFCITTICSFFTSINISAAASANTVKYEQTFETNDGTFEPNGTTMEFTDKDGSSCLKVTKASGVDYWKAARPKSTSLVPIVRANGAGVYRYKAMYKTDSGAFNIRPLVNVQLTGNTGFVSTGYTYEINSTEWKEVSFDVVVGEFDTSKLSGVYIGQQLPSDGKDKEYTYYIGYMSFEKVIGFDNNLIGYGDFEDDQTNLNSYFQANGTIMQRISNGDHTYSLKVTKDANVEATKAARPLYEKLGTNVKDKGAGIYRYKARYKSESDTFNLKPTVLIQNSSSTSLVNVNNTVSVNPTTWTETCFDFVLQDASDVKYVFIGQQVPSKESAYTYYIDYMSLEKVGEIGENVVPNGDFEDERVNTYFENSSSVVSHERVGDNINGHYLKMIKSANGDYWNYARPKNGGSIVSNFKALGGGTYVYSCKYKSGSGAQTINPGIKFKYGSEGKAVDVGLDNYKTVINDSEWTEISYIFELPSDVADGLTNVYVMQYFDNKEEQRVLYLDDMKIYKVDIKCTKTFVDDNGSEISDITNYDGTFRVKYTVNNDGIAGMDIAVVTAVKNSTSLVGVDVINATAAKVGKVITTKTMSKNAGETVDTYCWDNLTNMRPLLANE